MVSIGKMFWPQEEAMESIWPQTNGSETRWSRNSTPALTGFGTNLEPEPVESKPKGETGTRGVWNCSHNKCCKSGFMQPRRLWWWCWRGIDLVTESGKTLRRDSYRPMRCQREGRLLLLFPSSLILLPFPFYCFCPLPRILECAKISAQWIM